MHEKTDNHGFIKKKCGHDCLLCLHFYKKSNGMGEIRNYTSSEADGGIMDFHKSPPPRLDGAFNEYFPNRSTSEWLFVAL